MTFELIMDSSGPVAAIVPRGAMTVSQVRTVYQILPAAASMDYELPKRWNVAAVYCDPQWAKDQKHRMPMLKPKGVLLAFL